MLNNKNSRLTAFLLVAILAFNAYNGINNAQAVNETAELPGLSSPFSKGIQGILGINRLAAWIASRQIKKEINKKVTGELDVNVKPYSGIDLIEGKVRRLNIKGENLVYDNAFYVSRFELHTDEDTPIWIDTDNGKIKKPVDADIMIHLHDTDLNRSFKTDVLKKQLSNIKVPLLGLGSQTIEMIEPEVAFSTDLLRFKTLLGIKGTSKAKALPLEIETGLEPEISKGTVKFKNLKIVPIPGIVNLKPIENILEKTFHNILNPSKLMPMDNAKLEVRSVDISHKGLLLKGRVRLLPDSNIEKLSGLRYNKAGLYEQDVL